MLFITIEATIGKDTFVPTGEVFDEDHIRQFETELESLIAADVQGCTCDDIIVTVSVVDDNSSFNVSSVSIPSEHPAIDEDYDVDTVRTHIETIARNVSDRAWERCW